MAFEVTLHQMIIFFLILAVGFVAGKKGVIKQESMPHLTQIISKSLLPVLIFYGTIATTKEAIAENAIIVVFAIVFYVVVTVILFATAKIMRLKGDRDKIFTFCFMFGNTGCVGIPRLVALFPTAGMLYMMLFTIVDQAIFWTFGIWMATGRDRQTEFTIKNFISPNIIAMALALIVVLIGVPVPAVINDTLATISNATSAMCMMYLGAMVCFSKWMQVLKCAELYVGIVVKMVLLPVIGGHIFMLIGLPQDMMVSMVAIMSLPIMTVVPMIASMNSNEGEYATGMTVVTLVVSVATIPLVQLLAFM